MNDTTCFLILRIITFIPSSILAIHQGYLLIKKRGNHNGMKPYRLLLFLFTLTFAIDSGIVAYGDFLKAFFNIGHGSTFTDISYLRYLARIIELTAIFYFYKLIFNAKYDKKH
jgi:hypothetical protein